MKLSIVIVNYNVKYFLEQCLCSVKKAIATIDAEVFVVDNHSTDNSIAYLQSKFPFVFFIENDTNVGFGKANNQVLAYCHGDYILFLNPDTIVPEDCFTKCIAFFEKNADCGALGIKMIDGSGTFLPESKRAFPSPSAAFFKLTGLSALFPTSPTFNQYSLGYLDEFSNHAVDVLAGAFIMVKSAVMQSIKGFDESFFMYGEDIDLSYRVQQLGYKNYYFAESTIIHFKGESTKRGSLNYVKMFYSAMSIFVQKHYKGSKAKTFSIIIQTAIFFRALLSLIKTFILKIGLPLMDGGIIAFSLWSVLVGWIYFERDGLPFPQISISFTVLSFAIIFLITGALSGMYDKLYKPVKAFTASIVGIVVMMAVYSLWPERLRFSRGVVIFGGFAATLAVTFFRWILLKLAFIETKDEETRFQQTIAVGSINEYKRVEAIFSNAGLKDRLLGRIKINGEEDSKTIGDIKLLRPLLHNLNIKEVIFCEGYLTYHQIIQIIQTLPHNVSYRFMGSNTNSIVGSDSKATAGETLTEEGLYKINEAYHKRMKRIVDIVFSLLLLLTFPLQLLFIQKGWKALQNACMIILGKATWVGYCLPELSLPKLPKNILTCYGFPVGTSFSLNKEAQHQLDVQYAKNYDCGQDIVLLLKHYRLLGG